MAKYRHMPLLKTYKRELYMPDADCIPEFIKAAKEVGRQERSARELARAAAVAGFLLIGSNTLKEWHYPVNRRYGDLRDGFKVKPIPEANGKPALRAGFQPDVAILGGLFGNLNDKRERNRRCKPITGQEINFGWGTDVHKSRAQRINVGEDAHVATHARKELINAAIDPDDPFTGYIHAILPHPSFIRIAHDIGQYVGAVRRKTIFSIPLVGYLDLPLDIIPTNYTQEAMNRINPR